MATTREIVQAIEVQSQELQFLDDARLEVHRRTLQAILCAFPMLRGNVVCAGCSQRLEVQMRPVSRDAGNGHCTKSSNGHAPELV